MRIRIAVLMVALGAALAFSSYLPAQSAPASAGAKAQKPGLMSGGIPDLSGIWDPDFHGPEGIQAEYLGLRRTRSPLIPRTLR